MFVVLLRLSSNRGRAGHWMEAHKAWLQRGFDDGVFLMAGNLQPQAGGGILAHNVSLPDLQRRLAEDPFVADDVVCAEVIEVTPSRVDPRVAFLMPATP